MSASAIRAANTRVNRHNVGFMAVDAIAARHGFPAWRKRFHGSPPKAGSGGEQVLLLKPQTFMNDRGRSVGEALRFFKLELADVIVFHDELDLAPGKVRVKTGGGNAGHNGLRSITAHIGNDYARVRIGIGHPGGKELVVVHHVLHDFAKADATGSSRCSTRSPRRRPTRRRRRRGFLPTLLTPCKEAEPADEPARAAPRKRDDALERREQPAGERQREGALAAELQPLAQGCARRPDPWASNAASSACPTSASPPSSTR